MLSKFIKRLWVLLIIIAVLVVWQGISFSSGGKFFFWGSEKYQAVFLDNNQVYFGKLSKENSSYPVLKNVFYLQVTRMLQPQDPSAQPIPDINLVKLGGELHGPEDEMIINKDHIIFIEDLKSGSQVLEAIMNFKD